MNAEIASATAPIFVDAGGRRLAVTVLGEGEPLVLLEVGFGAESSSWAEVARGVAGFTRVGYYDRAGRGASEPAPRPRDPDTLVQDVRTVVHALAGAGPVVLVGQSFGGLLVRLYAHRFPAEVGGIVLVDSMHEDQFDACAPHLPAPFEGEPPTLTTMRGFWSGGWRDPARNAEGIDLLACQEAGHGIDTLDKLPVRVLTASTFTCPPRMPPQTGLKLQGIWEELQSRLAGLSIDSSHQVLADSGHFIQNDQPQVVIDSIAQLASYLRRGHAPGAQPEA